MSNNIDNNIDIMNIIKQDIIENTALLNSINLKKKNIENHIIELRQQLYNICPHANTDIIFNYYDRTTKKCCNCGYEE